MKICALSFLSLLILFIPLMAFSTDFTQCKFEADIGLWMTSLDASAMVSTEELPGTNLDASEDLGIDDSQSVFDLKAALNLTKRHKFRFGFFNTSYDGKKTLEKAINFNGETYLVGSSASSEIDLQKIEAGYEFGIISNSQGYFGVGLALKYFEAGAKIDGYAYVNDESVYVSEEESVSVPIPALGASAAINFIPRLALTGSIYGLAFEDSNLLEAEVALKFLFTPNIGVKAAYAVFDVHGEDNDGEIELDYQMRGPLGSILIRF